MLQNWTLHIYTGVQTILDMTRTHSSVTFHAHCFLLLRIMIGVCVIWVVSERVFTASGRVYTFIPSTELVYVATTSSTSSIFRVVGQLITIPWRSREVIFCAATLPIKSRPRRPLMGGAAIAWSVCQAAAVFAHSLSLLCGLRGWSPAGTWVGGLRLLLLVLCQLLPSLLQLLLKNKNGTLHTLYLLIKLDDEVIQFYVKKTHLLQTLNSPYIAWISDKKLKSRNSTFFAEIFQWTTSQPSGMHWFWYSASEGENA